MAEQVLLGLADSHVSEIQDASLSWSVNKFGGVANWMQDCLPNQFPVCDICNSLLYHVAQIYCPLEGSEYHRILNVFGCLKKRCSPNPGSWKVLRSQCLANQESIEGLKEKEAKDFVEESWCDDADDWGSDDNGDINTISSTLREIRVEENQPSSQLKDSGDCEHLQKNETNIPKDVPNFVAMHVHVIEEPRVDVDGGLDYERSLLKEYEEREGSLSEVENATKTGEKYEKSTVAHGDKSFHKFLKRVRRCKEQCLRYSRNGTPILLSNDIQQKQYLENIPACMHCGSKRVFEAQLMPALALVLKKRCEGAKAGIASNDSVGMECVTSQAVDSPNSDAGSLDFGTVYIYTCEKSCSNFDGGYATPAEEHVILCPSPDSEVLDEKLS